MRVLDKEIQTVVPLGLLDKMLLSCSNVFFVLPPWRKNNFFTFFIFRRGGRIFLLHFLSSAVAEEQFLYVFYLPPRRKNNFFTFFIFRRGGRWFLFHFTIFRRGGRPFVFCFLFIRGIGKSSFFIGFISNSRKFIGKKHVF